jgi:hypothetical protein
LFDSTFSLKNTGETIRLKNEAGEEVDSATYSDADGAKDDGNSLHRDGDTFYAAAPSPGEFEGGVAERTQKDSNDSEATTSAVDVTTTTLYSYETVTIQPPEDVYIRVPDTIIGIVGAYTEFSAETYDATGAAFGDGVVFWSFGDGGTASGRSVRHKYWYEGEYVAVVTVERGSVFDEKRIEVVVVPARISISVGEQGDVVTIANATAYEVDLSNWRIHVAGQYFSIPYNTYVAANKEIRFSKAITELPIISEKSEVRLVFPDGELVATGKVQPVNTIEVEVKNKPEEEIAQVEVTQAAYVDLPPRPPQENTVIGNIVTEQQVQPYSAATTITTAVQAEEGQIENAGAAAAVVLSQSQDAATSDVYWYVVLGALISVAVMVVLLAKPRQLRVHGFEIIEDNDE